MKRVWQEVHRVVSLPSCRGILQRRLPVSGRLPDTCQTHERHFASMGSCYKQTYLSVYGSTAHVDLGYYAQ
jgi:hypothetical protein